MAQGTFAWLVIAALTAIGAWIHIRRLRLWLGGPAFALGPARREITAPLRGLHAAQAPAMLGWSLTWIAAVAILIAWPFGIPPWLKWLGLICFLSGLALYGVVTPVLTRRVWRKQARA